MIKPVLQNEALLSDIRAAREDVGHFHLWWLGQSGFLVQWDDKHLLFDPYLSDSLTRKYAATDKPHVRMTEIPVAPQCLDCIDVATSSHAHTDHLDPDTLMPLLRVNPQMDLVIPETNRELVADRLRTMIELPTGLEQGQSARVKGFAFHAVPAAHELVEKDDTGRCKFLGYVVEFGNWTVYHSGDTVRYDGMEDLLRRWQIDVAILPINGREPERRVAGNLDGREAAELAKAIGARLVIPCHYEMFEFNTASPALFQETAEKIGQPCRVLRCGERWSSAQLLELA